MKREEHSFTYLLQCSFLVALTLVKLSSKILRRKTEDEWWVVTLNRDSGWKYGRA